MNQPGPGHNKPPANLTWNGFCWRKAHAAAWRTPPREVVLRRLARAGELGLDYRSYAAILMDVGAHPKALIVSVGPAAMAPRGLAAPVAAKLKALPRPRKFLLVPQREDVAGARHVAGALGVEDGDIAALAGETYPTVLVRMLKSAALTPKQAVLVGWSQADRGAAETAGIAGFQWGQAYFGR